MLTECLKRLSNYVAFLSKSHNIYELEPLEFCDVEIDLSLVDYDIVLRLWDKKIQS